jgi:general secretion pathway protein C
MHRHVRVIGAMKHRWLFDIVVVSVVVYFGVSAVVSVLEAELTPGPLGESVPVTTSQALPSNSHALDQYAIITERNLFGGVAGNSSLTHPDEAALAEMPPALESLGLRLVGTVVTGTPELDLALIEDRDTGRQEFHHRGDRVKQAVIKRILRHHVIINAGERDEVLTMEPEASGARPASPAETVASRPSQASGVAIRLDREEFDSSLLDLNDLMTQVRLRPFVEGDGPEGFLVSDIKAGSLFAKMGLESGDVIKRVNDQTITSTEQAFELYRSLMEEDGFALEIERGANRHELTYEIR